MSTLPRARGPRAPARSPGTRPIRAIPAAMAVPAILLAAPLPAQAPHPMDPLTFQEHRTVLEVLREADRYDADTGVSLVLLHEPATR
jgi:Cu2+-containing amine oxidase